MVRRDFLKYLAVSTSAIVLPIEKLCAGQNVKAGKLTVIAARPGEGRVPHLYKQVLAQKGEFLLFTKSQQKQDIRYRLMSVHSGESYYALKHNLVSPQKAENVQFSRQKVESLIPKIMNIDSLKLEAECFKAMSKHSGITVVYFDEFFSVQNDFEQNLTAFQALNQAGIDVILTYQISKSYPGETAQALVKRLPYLKCADEVFLVTSQVYSSVYAKSI